MTVQYIFGTGFEYGSIAPFVQSGGPEFPVVEAGGYTGDWRIRIRGGGSAGWLEMPGITGSIAPDELYFSCAYHPLEAWNIASRMRMYVYEADGASFNFIKNSSNLMVCSLGGTPTITLTNGWNNFQFYAKLANSGGRIITKIDGLVDIDFTGDTLQGATAEFDRVRFYGSGGDHLVDDVIYGTGEWMGAVRFEPLRPNGDDTIEWEAEPTGTHYTTVDETAPGTGDYILATGTAMMEKYDTEDFPETGKIPLLVMQWAFATKASADDTKLEFVLDDGTEEITQPQEMTTSNAYYAWLWDTPPSGGSWSDALLDALLQGYRSELP